MKVAKLSGLCPGRLYSSWDTPGALFSSKLSQTRANKGAEWLCKRKIPITSNGNWILGFLACVGQSLNLLSHGVPHNNHVSGKIRCVLSFYVSVRLWAQVLFRKYCKNLVAKSEQHVVQYNGLQLNRIRATEYYIDRISFPCNSGVLFWRKVYGIISFKMQLVFKLSR